MKRFAILICAVVVALFAIFYFTGTRGGMARFSPHTLEFQIQSEYTLFFGGLQIYRSGYESTDHQLRKYLIESKLVASQKSANDRWESIFHWNRAWRDGFDPLYDTFSRYDDAILYWSKANPELARTYWAEGFKYLRLDHPADQWIGQQILNRAWRAESTEDLQKKIAEIIESGNRERALGTFDPEPK